MASKKRVSADSVARLAQLAALAPRSDFFALVSRLEQATRDAVRVGGDGPAHAEAIRFRHDPSMTFSSGDVSEAQLIERHRDPCDPLSPKRTVVEVTTAFLGLSGSVSPFPLYLAGEIAQFAAEGSIVRDFLDIFHHRILSLFYRLWMRYRYAWEYPTEIGDLWSKRVLSTAGIDGYEHNPLRRIPQAKMLSVLPLLVGGARNAHALRVVLRACLSDIIGDADVEILQFASGWSSIADEQRTRLGRVNCVLGSNLLLGSRVFGRNDKFRIRIAPLSLERYRRLAFEREHLSMIREIVDLVVREPLDFDLELVLEEQARPAYRLSSQSPATLGRNTWLRGRPGLRSVRIGAFDHTGRALDGVAAGN